MATVNVNSTVTLNQQQIRQINMASKKALEQTADALMGEIKRAQVMPFDLGTMQNEQTFVDNSKIAFGQVSIVTSTSYARRLYYHPEYNFQFINNANAQGRWWQDWIDGDKKDFASKAFKKLFKRESGT